MNGRWKSSMYDEEKKGKKEERRVGGLGGSYTYGPVQIRRAGLLIAG